MRDRERRVLTATVKAMSVVRNRELSSHGSQLISVKSQKCKITKMGGSIWKFFISLNYNINP